MSTPPPDDPFREPATPRRRWIYPLVVCAMLAGMALGAWWIWGRGDIAQPPGAAAQKASAAKTQRGRRGAGPAGGAPAQPVQAATARRTDIRIVQTALGTATALRTVTVKPRVDGQLQRVLFEEGQVVKEGQVLAQIDPTPFEVALAQAEGQLARDLAQLNNAKVDLERYRTLLAQDSIAKQQVDQQAALVRQLEGTIKVGEAQVANAKLQLSYTRITAPIAGRLGLRQVDAGNMVRGSDATGIAVITQVDPMGVLFTIPQDTLPRVLERLRAGERPPVEAWDREQKTLLARGRLITTDNQIDVATGTIRLKAEFENKDGKLFPNQFVNVRMVVDVRKDAVAVPTAAVQRGAQGSLVYVVRDDSTIASRAVTIGPTEGQLTAIESGLEPGERVVTDGIDRIREGARVEVTTPGAGLRAPSGGDAGKGGRAGTQGMTPEQRKQALEKRMESMTPEQREAFRKRREAREGKAPAQ